MSSEAVNQFLQKIAEDETLQSSLAQALEAENDREAVTQIGQQHGYTFTSDELWAEVKKRQHEFETRQAAGELSDEELEAVAGGASPALTFMTFLGTVASVSLVSSGVAVSQSLKW
jgi:predicted ribosomally synthesized peptide with nif11-like leader